MLNRTPTTIVVNDITITAHAIVTVYLYGQYLHKDGRLRRRLGLGGVPEALTRDGFLRAIHILGQGLLGGPQRRQADTDGRDADTLALCERLACMLAE